MVQSYYSVMVTHFDGEWVSTVQNSVLNITVLFIMTIFLYSDIPVCILCEKIIFLYLLKWYGRENLSSRSFSF